MVINRDYGEFAARAHEWQAYLELHGSQPTNLEANGPEAKRLYAWMSRQRLEMRRGELDARSREILDEVCPTWQVLPLAGRSTKVAHEERAKQYVSFVEMHGRKPSATASDVDEKALQRWMANSRTSYRNGTMHKDDADAISRHLPGWAERQRRVVARATPAWGESLTALEAYLRINGGMYPGTDAPSLSNWLRTQRVQLTRGEIKDDRVAQLDAVAPLWRIPDARSRTNGYARLEEVLEFVRTHERLPRATSAGEEARHARWLTKRTEDGAAEVLERLDVALPGWRLIYAKKDDTTDHRYVRRVAEIREFVRAHGRNPVAQGTTTENESRMAFWLTRQRRRLRNGELEPKYRRMLDETIPDWAVTRTSHERKTPRLAALTDIAVFFSAHGRVPELTAQDLTEHLYAMTLAEFRNTWRAGKLPSSSLIELDWAVPGWRDEIFSAEDDERALDSWGL